MRGVGDKVAPGIEQRAREIEPLADVDRSGGPLQRGAHLLGDAHELSSEDRKPGGIALRADAGDASGGDTTEDQISDVIHARAPAGLDDGRRHEIDDQRRPVERMAGRQSFARHHRRIAPCSSHMHRDDRQRCGGIVGQIDQHRLNRWTLRDRFGDEPIDDQGLRARKTELGDMRVVETGDHRRCVRQIELDRMLCLAAAQMNAALYDDGVGCDALRH